MGKQTKNTKEKNEIVDMAVLIAKANRYDAIKKGIEKFYDEEENNEDTDLCTVGEWISTYFGYL
jgi:hypothetical protein